MKLILLFTFQAILSISCFSQDEPWFFYNQDNSAIFSIKNYKDDLLLIFEGPAYNSSLKSGFKVIGKDGTILKKVETPIHGTPYINEIGDNYLLNYIDFKYNGQKEIRYVSRLFDNELNLVEDTAILMSNLWCEPDPTGLCDVGSNQFFFMSNNSQNTIIGTMGHKFDSTQLFLVRYNDLGFLTSLEIDNKWMKVGYNSSTNIKVFPQTDSTFYINQNGNLELRNYDLKILKIYDYTGYGQNQILPWDIVDFERLEDSTFLMMAGAYYEKPNFEIEKKIILGNLDKNLEFQYKDTTEVPSYIVGDPIINFLFAGVNKAIVKENNNTYTSILSYGNNESFDTSSSRIVVFNYDKNLKIICQQTYVARDKDIIIKDLIRDSKGDYFVAVVYGKREFQYLDVNSTIIKINEGCSIEGMETIQEYLGELSTSIINETFGIRLWQNPIDNKLVIHAERSFPPGDPTIDIYDFSGKLIIESKAHINGTMASISAEKLTNGLYIYQMKVDGKLIGVGKFAKK